MEQKIRVLDRRFAMDEETFAPVMVVRVAIPIEPLQDRNAFMPATTARQELANGLVAALEEHMEENPLVHPDDDRVPSLRELTDEQQDVQRIKFKERLANKITDIDEGSWLIHVLVKCGLAVTPKGEVTLDQAEKLVRDGNISVDGVKVDDVTMRFFKANGTLFPSGASFTILKGTKNKHIVFIGDK